MSGMCKVSRNVSLETCTIPKLMSRFLTFWTCGSIPGQLTRLSYATAKMAAPTALPTYTWKGPTSIAVGSIPPCCKPAPPRAARPIAVC